MEISSICKSYFNGFNELLDLKKQKKDSKEIKISSVALSVLKVVSYFTILIPVGFLIASGIASLYGRLSEKNELSSLDKSVKQKAQRTFGAQDDPLKNSRRLSGQLEANSSTDQSCHTDKEAPRNQTEVRSLESQIASIKEEEIQEIATALLAKSMHQLSIGTHIVYQDKKSFIKYDKDSTLMQSLLPTCTVMINDSFKNPYRFAKEGIVFDFLNSEKNGLIDKIENKNIIDEITRNNLYKPKLFSMTFKAIEAEELEFEISLYRGEIISTYLIPMKSLLEIAKTGLINP